MSAKTGIEWTDATWNPVAGCSKVSEGCRNCYAMTSAARVANASLVTKPEKRTPAQKAYTAVVPESLDGRRFLPIWNNRVVCMPERLTEPFKWRSLKRVFVNSMSDLFHEDVPDEFIGAVFASMQSCPQHTFQILTKRPARMAGLLSRAGLAVLPNVWLGVSVENQQAVDERIPLLLQTPAAVRFLSVEPLLGRVWIEMEQLRALDWVIVGGESGTGARPMHPEWALAIRDQCVAAGVPFFFKQWGEWLPMGACDAGQSVLLGENEAAVALGGGPAGNLMVNHGQRAQIHHAQAGLWRMARVGKHVAGRLLDGKEYNEFPRVAAAV